ncbi:hypothetical protein PR048_014757 [Dryococelus australis]|uniref:Reverse transcriptase domain-containing protein n=1 Tax=Dryococelus australis TaxID=614101 RepID=A0ABQ9HF26_9NEOP|nr:hypothetical protein PR048_014757 [Dryococelus australis]
MVKLYLPRKWRTLILDKRRKEKLPDEWHEAIIVPIHKKEMVRNCDNHRGISLLTVTYKMISYILFKRLTPYAKKCIVENKCRFRRNRLTVYPIFRLRKLVKKRGQCTRYDAPFFISKTYVTSSRACTKLEGMISDDFHIVIGLIQGDGISPMLFNVALKITIRALNTVNEGIGLNGLHRVLGYADDLGIISDRNEGHDKMYKKYMKWGKG